VEPISEILLEACKELISDAKAGCIDIVFKEICLDILFKARHILSEEDFKKLLAYASEKVQEKAQIEIKGVMVSP